MKKILVAIDFSSASINAAKYAVQLAVDIQADVTLFHVYQPPAIYTHLASFLSLEEMHHNAALKINEVNSELTTLAHGRLNILNLLKTGSFFNVLQQTCEEINPDLVIMGSQGTTAPERLVLGEHSVYAMIHLNWPLITVPVKASYIKIQKIALACDFANLVESISISSIIKLVNMLHAKLYIVHAGKMGKANPEVFSHGAYLKNVPGISNAEIYLLTVDNIDEGLIEFMNEHEIDLLIVLPKRRDFLQTLLHGSNTKHFVLHSRLPVMALHYE